MRSLAFCALLFGVWAAAAGTACAQGDAAAGATFFRGRCTSCHTVDRGGVNKIGPNLFAVYGRKAGLATGYSYSSAMQASGIVWTADKLKAFLANPRVALPGTKMIYAGISNDKDSANVIAYLATLK
jgi:cytochrome c